MTTDDGGAAPPRVMITGASGFVGRTLVACLRADPSFAQSTLISAGRSDPGICDAHVALDLGDPSNLDGTIAEAAPDAVVHLAGMAFPAGARRDPGRARALNVEGAAALAAAVLSRAPQARFVHVSSSEVYGASFNRIGGPVDEDVALAPTNAYGASKAAGEILVRQMAEDGLDVVVVRPFNHTGPGQATDYVVPAFASQIAAIERGEREPVVRVGNLDARRDLLDVRDVVRAYAACLKAPGLRGRVLNLASGEARRIGDVLDSLRARARVEVTVEVDPQKVRPNDVPLSVGDARRAADLLGWTPRIAFEDTLADVLNAQRGKAGGGDA